MQTKKFRDHSCCPTFILVTAGPWFCILGAIFTDKVIVEPLTDLISLLAKPRDDGQLQRVTRIFQALRLALNQLNNFYTTLTLDAPMDEQRYFSYRRQYNDQAGNAVNFQYLYMLTDDFKRPIWKARTNDGRAIVIKFTRRYNHNAHILCANQGLAPELHFHDNQDVYGFRMIVMDYADGVTLSSPLVGKASLSVRNKIFQDVQNAISTLRTNNLVFGDLRLPNVLMVNNRGMLVDFEWCGEDNNARYPFSISQSVLWPNGVEPGAVMRRMHDDYWLNHIRRHLIG